MKSKFASVLIVASILSVVARPQSLSVVAVTNPAVHGVPSAPGFQSPGRVFVCDDAFYLVANGPGVVTTVSRWTESGGLEVVGVANPISQPGPQGAIAPTFMGAVAVGGWVYFLSGVGNVAPNNATGGIWRCPASGSGPVTLYSTTWPSSLPSVNSGISAHIGGLYFIANWGLARMDLATGSVANLGQVPGPGFFRVTADASGVYCSTFDAMYRYDTSTQSFSVLAILGGAPWGLTPAEAVADNGVVYSFCYANPAGCIDTLLRIDAYSGSFTQQVVSCFDPSNKKPAVANGVVDYLTWVAPPGPALYVNSVAETGAQSVLLPSPCTLNVGEVCEANAFLRGSGDVVHVVSRGLQPYDNIWAIATYSPSPQPAGVTVVDPLCSIPESPTLNSSVPTLGSIALLSLHGSPSVGGVIAHGSPASSPVSLGACFLMLDLPTLSAFPIATNSAGDWSVAVVTPPSFALFAGTGRRWQAVLFSASGLEVSNALDWTFGL